MKIALYARQDNPNLPDFIALLERFSVEYIIAPQDTQCCTHAISFGGDGTFLSAVRKMGRTKRLPLMGINSGRLGFLATVSLDDTARAIQKLIKGDYKTEYRSMLDVSGSCSAGTLRATALNEFTLQKKGTAMVKIELSIHGALVASYWADGVILSTPTGSTAYSMSVSGSILAPDCNCMIISPIAPHNLSLRPLVISDSAQVSLKISSRMDDDSICTVDNREFDAPSGSVYEIVKSEHSQDVIVFDDNNFYDTLREKLLWGVDLRN